MQGNCSGRQLRGTLKWKSDPKKIANYIDTLQKQHGTVLESLIALSKVLKLHIRHSTLKDHHATFGIGNSKSLVSTIMVAMHGLGRVQVPSACRPQSLLKHLNPV